MIVKRVHKPPLIETPGMELYFQKRKIAVNDGTSKYRYRTLKIITLKICSMKLLDPKLIF